MTNIIFIVMLCNLCISNVLNKPYVEKLKVDVWKMVKIS